MIQTQAALVCAERADSPTLTAWVLGNQAMTREWYGALELDRVGEALDAQPGLGVPAGSLAGSPFASTSPVMTVRGAGHLPQRPSWDCLVCQRPWPCDAARERLRLLYVRTTLSILMVDRLQEAVQDMPTVPPSELFDRFLAWTRG